MATFKFNGMDELTLSLSQLAQTPEEVQYSMLEAGATRIGASATGAIIGA